MVRGGMVVAPHPWGRFADALLVGNEDGGQINAFDPRSGRFLGTVRDARNPAPSPVPAMWQRAIRNFSQERLKGLSGSCWAYCTKGRIGWR
jgi:hypothetical protein